MDVHGNVIREVPFDASHEGAVYTGRLQVLGPGFAPFKPYLRPKYFYIRVRAMLFESSRNNTWYLFYYHDHLAVLHNDLS